MRWAQYFLPHFCDVFLAWLPLRIFLLQDIDLHEIMAKVVNQIHEECFRSFLETDPMFIGANVGVRLRL